ncbi:MAG: TldD/PmbA family protein [Acholeplasmataceae bacterium]|nr:TldD/PmbA family protein [Acholeplasmataceae bacterium]
MNYQKLFDVAKKKGFTDVQVYLVDNRDLSLNVFKGNLEKYEIADYSSLTIKGVYNKKLASYVTEVMDDEAIDSIVEKLLENAKAIDSLDESIIYEGDEHYEELKDTYNSKLPKIDVARKIELVKKLETLLKEKDPRVVYVDSFYSETTRSVSLQNTKGLKLMDKANSAMLGGSILVKGEEDQRNAFDLVISNDFADFSLEELADEIVQRAVASLGAKPVPSKEYEIVFDQNAFALLILVFQGIFSADNVQKGMSLLKDRLDTTIGSEKLTIVDDPFMKKSSRSRSFDDEGVATKYKELVKNGVLKTYLHNLKTANKDGVKSTGNAFSGTVAAVNLKVLPGDKSQNELVESVVDGILINDLQGGHSGANPISGDFSLQATGFTIENGVKTKPVALITVSGNFIELMKKIVLVGNDLKTSYYGITCPSVKISKMPISGI